MALRGMPTPVVDYDTKPFWDALDQGRLALPYCAACGRGRWPPGPLCPHCQSDRTQWRDAPPRGRLYSWVVVHHPTHPALKDQVPYVIALVDFGDRLRLLGNIVNWTGQELQDGQVLSVVFERRDDGVAICNFAL